MINILGEIYNWFQSLFGQDLSYYLWGYDPVTGGYTNPNLFNHIGLIAIIVSLLLVIWFYFIFNHPSYCKWWSWLITMGVDSVIGLFVGHAIVFSKYQGGYIPQQLMYQFDQNGNIVANLIGPSNCWGFGIANMIVSILLFIFFSFIFKWWSSAAKYVPF